MAVVDATLLTACGAENYGTERRWLSVAGIGESETLWVLSERDACNAMQPVAEEDWRGISPASAVCFFSVNAASVRRN